MLIRCGTGGMGHAGCNQRVGPKIERVVHLPSATTTLESHNEAQRQAPRAVDTRAAFVHCQRDEEPTLGRYQVDIRPILDSVLNEEFLGPAQPDRPIANRSRIRRLLLHLSIAYCLHPKLDQDPH